MSGHRLFSSGQEFDVGAIRSRLLMAVAITAFVCLRFLVAVPGRFLRELTCDDLAVRWSGKPLALAAALVKVARMEPAAHLGTSGFAHHEVFTLRRVRRLIDYRSPRPRLALQRAASMLAVGALVALAHELITIVQNRGTVWIPNGRAAAALAPCRAISTTYTCSTHGPFFEVNRRGGSVRHETARGKSRHSDR